MSKRDYYEVLGLHPKADHDLIVQAYWHLARKYKGEIAHDLRVRRKLEELNHAFAVLGSPADRSAYDAERIQQNEPKQRRAKREKAEREEGTAKRVSIEVSFWRLPAGQGIIAATATLALAILALFAGAHLIVTLVLAVVAVAAALIPSVDEWKVLTPNIETWMSEGEREVKARELEKSTSAIVARWRDASNLQSDSRSLAQLFNGVDYNQQNRVPRNRGEQATE